MKLYDLLEKALLKIEMNIKEGINVDDLAESISISSVHLRRLFRFAFKQTISKYIRSRRLSASLDDLLQNKLNILDIALDYGFEYEQSYIRSFKQEFGITPGDFRINGKIIKITPPIRLFDRNKLEDGVLFGPDIVVVPGFHMIGKLHDIPRKDAVVLAQEAALQFWKEEKLKVETVVDPNVYIGLTRNMNWENSSSEYLPSVRVKNLKNIPNGLCGDTFETSLCVRFRYIGQHHYYELNSKRAYAMYESIEKYFADDNSQYDHIHNTKYKNILNQRHHHFERIDTKLYDGTYCQMEWFAPIQKKDKNDQK
ncbi:MAG: helix-turn-helix transcriptional regulator [Treponema sp.]|nr:helix-turn-helix transcriptional regulator [Treponema sp.]